MEGGCYVFASVLYFLLLLRGLFGVCLMYKVIIESLLQSGHGFVVALSFLLDIFIMVGTVCPVFALAGFW